MFNLADEDKTNPSTDAQDKLEDVKEETTSEEMAKSSESEATGAVESAPDAEDSPDSASQQIGSEAQETTSVPEPSEPSGASTTDEPAPEKKADKPISKELEKIIEQIEKLSVLELSDLVHALEDRFGVTAAPSVSSVQAAPGGAASGEAGQAEEQTVFNVILANAGANKIGVIKAVRELVSTLGLKEAKDLVEAAPKPVLESVNKQTAEEAKTKLTAAGATVELQ